MATDELREAARSVVGLAQRWPGNLTHMAVEAVLKPHFSRLVAAAEEREREAWIPKLCADCRDRVELDANGEYHVRRNGKHHSYSPCPAAALRARGKR